jgi:hypothetical protein
MRCGRSVVLAGSCLLLFGSAAYSGQGQEAPSSWIPFTANVADQSTVDDRTLGHVEFERVGFYARDGRGNSYQKYRYVRTPRGLPVRGASNDVVLHDRTNHIAYSVDPVRRSFRKEGPDPSDLRAMPLTRGEFDQARKGEKFIGKKVISGLECEGFQTPTRFSKKYVNETWYAPSLNFMVIKATVYVNRLNRFEVLFKDFKIGTEPDPSLFRLPEGLKEVQKGDLTAPPASRN